MTLTERQKTILRHTLGDKPYQNHFAAGEGHIDGPALDALVEAGHMTVRDDPRSSMWMYQATDKGRKALGITSSAVSQWGNVPPLKQQDEIKRIYGVAQ